MFAERVSVKLKQRNEMETKRIILIGPDYKSKKAFDSIVSFFVSGIL